jgi:type IV secretory pathway VirB10-like protein
MRNKKFHPQGSQGGFVAWQLVIGAFVIGVLGFAGGTVYTAQQARERANSQAAREAEDKAAGELKASQKQAAEKKAASEPVQLPAAEKPKEAVKPPAAPPEKKSYAPAPDKKAPTSYPAKKEPAKVSATSSSHVGADAVALTMSLPAAYTGKCRALVKHMDGSNHMWLEAGTSSSSKCVISVPRAKLASSSNWQYYMYFDSHDYTVRAEAGKNTFSL